MRYEIETTLMASTQGTVELPEGKVWEDIEMWYVKWDTLFFQFKGENVINELEIRSYAEDVVDWKRPSEVAVFAYDGDGDQIDYGVVIDEQ